MTPERWQQINELFHSPSPDGKRLALSRGRLNSDVDLIKNSQ